VVADPAVAVAVAGYNGPVVHCFAGRSRGAATTAASDLGVWRYDSQSFLVNAAFQVFAANFDSKSSHYPHPRELATLQWNRLAPSGLGFLVAKEYMSPVGSAGAMET
jgi:hypothetical protein